MTDTPIIFSAPMVRALIDDHKTQTRRLAWREVAAEKPHDFMDGLGKCWRRSPWQKVKPGDRLIVKETHYRYGKWVKDGATQGGRTRWRFKAFSSAKIPDNSSVHYTDAPPDVATERTKAGWHKRPSIFMPRWASRLTLVVTATKIGRLQELSNADAEAEGVQYETADPPFWYVPGIYPHSITGVGIEDGWEDHAKRCYGKLWTHLHGHGAWEANPEVVALTFEVHQENIDALKVAA